MKRVILIRNKRSGTLYLSIFLLLAGVLLSGYTGYKSYALSFTHDESYTFLNYTENSVPEIVSNTVWPITANNHVLNTLFMKTSGKLFGTSEMSLRLHSFLAHILYLVFTILLLKQFKSPVLFVIGFILLNCNPYLLDFFSLSRGYGLSIAFMISSLYYLLVYTKNQKLTSLIFFLTLTLFAILSNFTLMSYMLSSILFVAGFMVIKKYPLKKMLFHSIPVFLSLIVFLYVYKVPVKKLIDSNELYFGGQKGIWQDTVLSSIQSYLQSSVYYDILFIFFKILVVVVLLIHGLILYKNSVSRDFQPTDYFFVLFLIIIVSSYLQHQLLKSNYFAERTALFLVPLFFLVTCNAFHFLFKLKKHIRLPAAVFSFITATAASIVFFSSINTTHFCNWKYDADTKKCSHN